MKCTCSPEYAILTRVNPTRHMQCPADTRDMAERIGIKTHIHALRHYSATKLLTAGVDLRTVAGRLGHGGEERQPSASTRHGWPHPIGRPRAPYQ
jgi:integrase